MIAARLLCISQQHLQSHLRMCTVQALCSVRCTPNRTALAQLQQHKCKWQQQQAMGLAAAIGASRSCLMLTPTELALAKRNYTMAAILLAFGGRFTPGSTLEHLSHLEQAAGAEGSKLWVASEVRAVRRHSLRSE
jgi:hypothetical protein